MSFVEYSLWSYVCIAVSQNSCYVFTVFLYFPYVQFILPLFSCYRNRDVVLIHPPTVAYLRWYNLRVPKIHGCSGYPPALGWWKPYYWWNWNFLIRVATTWQHGNSQLIFCGLCLLAWKYIHWSYQRGVVPAFLEASLQIFTLLYLYGLWRTFQGSR